MKVLPLHGPIVCEKCDVYFDDMTLFDAHMIEHEEFTKPRPSNVENPSIVCTSCGMEYPSFIIIINLFFILYSLVKRISHAKNIYI